MSLARSSSRRMPRGVVRGFGVECLNAEAEQEFHTNLVKDLARRAKDVFGDTVFDMHLFPPKVMGNEVALDE